MKNPSSFSRPGLPRLFCLMVGFALMASGRGQEWLDAVGDHLKFSACDGQIVLRFRGLMDLEAYYVEQPAPGLLMVNNDFLLNPRFTLNLDAQLGPQVYAFVQARADRGYDPATADAEVRLDQYALRYSPWEDGRWNVQAGKFATIVGNWSLRHDSWDNPFITAPVPYENLTAVWDTAVAPDAATLHGWIYSGKSLMLPVLWGASYTSGISTFGSVGKFDYAFELKNASLSSRPDSWTVQNVGFAHPTWSTRLGYRPDEAWNLGVSSSVGTYLIPIATGTESLGRGFDDYKQITIAQDLAYAWHHWQFWAECFQSRFEIPLVGDCDTVTYYVEAKYRFSPELAVALRWNQQFFNQVPDGFGGRSPWGSDLDRVDVAATWRFSPHTQVKVQYSFLDQGTPEVQQQSLVAAQFTIRF